MKGIAELARIIFRARQGIEFVIEASGTDDIQCNRVQAEGYV
jgi:hypothetical protein